MPTDKHYYAFISHSTRDAKVALWLRDKLVSYNIPASVQREHRASKRLRPVFIYQTDLAGSNLQDALQRELDDSQWLIVICSPEGAKSPYVNGEIEYFIESGRADKIIPFIVAGTPHAKNAEDECFPPALLHLAEEGTELRGINLEESIKQLGSKMGAVVNVVATMLGVRFGSMWNVYKRKQRRMMMIAAACALVLCLAGLFAWDYTRPTYRCYADYVDRWGVPEGIIELTKEQQSHRHRMYLFEYRRIPFGEPNAYSWRVVKVSYVNSIRVPQVYNGAVYDGFGGYVYGYNRSSIMKIAYSKTDGAATQLIFCDARGRAFLRHTLSERNGVKATIADFLSAEETKGLGFKKGVNSSYQHSNIVRYVYERDTNGFIIQQTYHANNDYNIRRSATIGLYGIYGLSFTIDSLGRNTKIEFLDENWQLTTIKGDIAGQKISYDLYGNISELTSLDKAGNPKAPRKSYATTHTISNTNGNCVEMYFLDEHRNLCEIKNLFYYDDMGNRIEYALYDTAGLPFEKPNVGHKFVSKYNKSGREIELAYYGIDGQLFLSPYFGALIKKKYDDRGNMLEMASYGVNGNLYGDNEGVAIRRYKYDENDNIIEWSLFDTICNLHCASGGFAIERITWNESGPIEISDYDIYDNPCLNTQGFFKRVCKYDERGNNIENSYYGIDGCLCLRDWGCAKYVSRFSDYDQEIERVYYGIDNKTCMLYSGISKWVKCYDENRRLIEAAYYDKDGHPVIYIDERTGEPYARKVCHYDERGNQIEEIHYDTEGNVID